MKSTDVSPLIHPLLPTPPPPPPPAPHIHSHDMHKHSPSMKPSTDVSSLTTATNRRLVGLDSNRAARSAASSRQSSHPGLLTTLVGCVGGWRCVMVGACDGARTHPCANTLAHTHTRTRADTNTRAGTDTHAHTHTRT